MTNCQVALYTSLDKEALKPWFKMDELLATKEFIANSGPTPLFVKLLPTTQESIKAKTIHVRDVDEDGRFTHTYPKYTIRNDHDLMKVIKKGIGLTHVTESDTVIISFDNVIDGEKYQIHRYAQDFAGYQKQEADAMEAETLLSMRTYLLEKLGTSSQELPSDIVDAAGIQIQEWDGILLVDKTLYLLEAKHSMSFEKVRGMAARVVQFNQLIKTSSQKEFNVEFEKVVGVACGTQFSIDGRKEAHRLGLLVVYPSGRRYMVDTGKIDFDYAIERAEYFHRINMGCSRIY